MKVNWWTISESGLSNLPIACRPVVRYMNRSIGPEQIMLHLYYYGIEVSKSLIASIFILLIDNVICDILPRVIGLRDTKICNYYLQVFLFASVLSPIRNIYSRACYLCEIKFAHHDS